MNENLSHLAPSLQYGGHTTLTAFSCYGYQAGYNGSRPDPTEAMVLYVAPIHFDIHGVPGVVVLTPNGGEKYIAGTTQTLQWYNYGAPYVDIEYSSDKGKTWNFVAHTNISSVSYDWIVPNITSVFCKIRVTNASYRAIWDVSDDFFTIIDPTSNIEDQENSPFTFSLSQNFPNPFNPTTSIKLSIPFEMHVSLRIYDVLGNKVATLVDENRSEGFHSIDFNADGLSTGLYFVRMEAGVFTDTRKMVFLK
jgi:hypothetical protein